MLCTRENHRRAIAEVALDAGVEVFRRTLNVVQSKLTREAVHVLKEATCEGKAGVGLLAENGCLKGEQDLQTCGHECVQLLALPH